MVSQPIDINPSLKPGFIAPYRRVTDCGMKSRIYEAVAESRFGFAEELGPMDTINMKITIDNLIIYFS